MLGTIAHRCFTNGAEVVNLNYYTKNINFTEGQGQKWKRTNSPADCIILIQTTVFPIMQVQRSFCTIVWYNNLFLKTNLRVHVYSYTLNINSITYYHCLVVHSNIYICVCVHLSLYVCMCIHVWTFNFSCFEFKISCRFTEVLSYFGGFVWGGCLFSGLSMPLALLNVSHLLPFKSNW